MPTKNKNHYNDEAGASPNVSRDFLLHHHVEVVLLALRTGHLMMVISIKILGGWGRGWQVIIDNNQRSTITVSQSLSFEDESDYLF